MTEKEFNRKIEQLLKKYAEIYRKMVLKNFRKFK